MTRASPQRPKDGKPPNTTPPKPPNAFELTAVWKREKVGVVGLNRFLVAPGRLMSPALSATLTFIDQKQGINYSICVGMPNAGAL